MQRKLAKLYKEDILCFGHLAPQPTHSQTTVPADVGDQLCGCRQEGNDWFCMDNYNGCWMLNQRITVSYSNSF